MTWKEVAEEEADFLTSETALMADIKALAMSGGAFDWLADEPDLYDVACGEVIRQSRAEPGVETRGSEAQRPEDARG